jgi:hypothetical protein
MRTWGLLEWFVELATGVVHSQLAGLPVYRLITLSSITLLVNQGGDKLVSAQQNIMRVHTTSAMATRYR